MFVVTLTVLQWSAPQLNQVAYLLRKDAMLALCYNGCRVCAENSLLASAAKWIGRLATRTLHMPSPAGLATPMHIAGTQQRCYIYRIIAAC